MTTYSDKHIDDIFQRDDIRHFFWDNVHFCIFAFDKDGYIRDVNKFFLKEFGYKHDEVVGRKYIQFLHPDDIEASQKIESDNIPNKTFVYGAEYFENRYRHKDGHYRTLRWHEGDGIYFGDQGFYLGYAKINTWTN